MQNQQIALGDYSPEKAALYHCFISRVRNGQGSQESLKGREHIGDTICRRRDLSDLCPKKPIPDAIF